MANVRVKKIAYTGVFVALIMGVGYALAVVPNVELVSALAFLSGVLMGRKAGILIGALGEFLFSAFNPLGSGLLFPALIVAQVLSMAVIGGVGGVCRGLVLRPGFSLKRNAALGAIGLGLTLFYNILVSIAYPLMAGFNLTGILTTLAAGLLFSLVHLIINTLIFGWLVPLTAQQLYRAVPFFQELP